MGDEEGRIYIYLVCNNYRKQIFPALTSLFGKTSSDQSIIYLRGGNRKSLSSISIMVTILIFLILILVQNCLIFVAFFSPASAECTESIKEINKFKLVISLSTWMFSVTDISHKTLRPGCVLTFIPLEH